MVTGKPQSARILLTGSSGWLGRFLGPMLRTAGYAVVGLDVAPGPETTVVGSIADSSLVSRVMREEGIDAVIHAAALHKPDLMRYRSRAFIDINITGTLNLLEASSACGVDRFIYTSTTSLMISQAVRAEQGRAAVWLDETRAPIEPRNAYGATKLAAENLCRIHHIEHGLNVIVLRTARFFPEEDDTHRDLCGMNLKANEFLHRRLTVQDAARAHIVALERARELAFGLFVISAPTPFTNADSEALKGNAADVVTAYYPDAPALYDARGWQLPQSIGRVYDAGHAERVLGFRCTTDFAAILAALSRGEPLPFAHDSGYIAPQQAVPASEHVIRSATQ